MGNDIIRTMYEKLAVSIENDDMILARELKDNARIMAGYYHNQGNYHNEREIRKIISIADILIS